ncbi:MAG: hypothetical protein HOV80_34290 [Polyangiaceae bacterium]|nr:hypothetical protein [Polyangiaceae bacterium]
MQNPAPRPRFFVSAFLAPAFFAVGLFACSDDDPEGTGGGGGSGAGETTTSGATTSSNASSTSSSSSGTGGAGGGAPEADIEIIELGMPVDLTPDGSIALIQDMASPVGDAYFFDTATKELTLETQIGDPLRTIATGLSAAGHISALHNEPVQAGIWSEAEDWRDIASPFAMGCGEDLGAGFDVSADGSAVVGLMWNGCGPEAFLWTDDGGAGEVTTLDVLGEPFEGQASGPTNRATVISDDGLVIAGFAQNGPVDRSPAIWRADGTGFMIDPTNQDAPGEVLSISTDGSIVAGIWGNAGFAFTEADGVVDLGLLPNALPGDPVYPNAIAADGGLIFGGVGNPFFTVPMAFVWSPEHGMRSLADIVTANGITVPDGLVLSNVLAASTDGSVLLGTVLDELGAQKTFVLRLPVSAYE